MNVNQTNEEKIVMFKQIVTEIFILSIRFNGWRKRQHELAYSVYSRRNGWARDQNLTCLAELRNSEQN